MTDPKSRADRVRALLQATPGLTKTQLRALLPTEMDSLGLPRPVTAAQVASTVGAMTRDKMLERVDDGYRLARPRRDDSPEAKQDRRRARQQRYEAKRGPRVRQRSKSAATKARPREANGQLAAAPPKAFKATAFNVAIAPPTGQARHDARPVKETLPCTEAFIRAHPHKLEVLPTFWSRRP